MALSSKDLSCLMISAFLSVGSIVLIAVKSSTFGLTNSLSEVKANWDFGPTAEATKLMFNELDAAAAKYETTLNYLDLKEPRVTVANITSLQTQDLAIVTAFSANHVEEFKRVLCRTLQSYNGYLPSPQKKIIVYLLEENITTSGPHDLTKECPLAQIQFFPFHLFPTHVRELGNYSFKPLTVALALLQFKAIYWADTSTSYDNKGHGKNLKDYLKDAQKKNNSFLLSSATSHSIYAATNPGMYNFLPIDQDVAKRVKMKAAGLALWIGTREAKSTVLYRWVQCALVEKCIAPQGSRQSCSSKELSRGQYAGCHRYDQSALNIIANMYFESQQQKFFLETKQWITKRLK